MAVGVDLSQPFFQLKQGDTVEILGQTKSAFFGNIAEPRVLARSIRVTGKAALPEARPVNLTTLVSFSNFDQWVSLECFVMEYSHANGEMLVRMVAPDGWADAYVRMPDATAIPKNLHGARLRLTGINAGTRQFHNAFFIPSPDQMEVIEPGTADIFDTTEVSVSDVIAHNVELGRRWRVKGTVAAVIQQRKLVLVAPDAAMAVYMLIPRQDEPPGKIFGDAGRWATPQAGDVVELVGSAINASSLETNAMGMHWCHLRKVAQGPPPKANAVDLQTLMSWRKHDEWCSVEGVVTGWMQEGSVRHYAIIDAHGHAIVQVRDTPSAPFPRDLHGALIRFTGISRSRMANPGEALVVPSPSHLEVLKLGAVDPFAVPQTSVAEIAAHTPSPLRVRAQGVVVARPSSGVLYVRTSEGALCLSLQPPWQRSPNNNLVVDAGPLPTLTVGDEVEVVGSPIEPKAGVEVAGFDLYQTHVRVTGKGGAPAPVPSTLREIAAGSHTSDLVELNARVVSSVLAPHGREWRQTLTLEADGETMPAVYQGMKVSGFSRFEPDLEVLVHAVVDRATPDSPRQLWLSSDTDIRVIGVSSVVLQRRLWMYGGGGLGIMILLGGWIATLRRSNREKTRVTAELKTANDSARESEQRWKLLFEQSPLSVQIFSPDGQTKRFNQAWKNLFRLNDEQGYAFNVLQAPDLIASGAVAHIQKAFQGEVVHVPPVPYPIPSDPPETRWIGGVLYPVKNAAGEIMEVVTIHNDITESKRAAEALMEINHLLENRVEERTSELQKTQVELQRALEQERELGELKSRFVTMVSHEFRTPLGIIMSAVELLQHYSDRLPEDEKTRQLAEIQSSTKHMGGLMEQVLLLGRAEAGKLTCKPRPLDIVCFADRIIDETQSISDRKCPITLETGGDLAGASVDEALLRHILSNLVANAVKYSPPGAEVLLRIRRESREVVFMIIDRGIGIPEKDRARLFEAFHRCSNVGDTPGTGLGLVIVKRCVDLHGGTIEVRSEPGCGTTFTVRLPLFS